MSQSRHGSSGGRRISALLFSLLSRVSGWLDAWRRRRQARSADAAASQRTLLLQFEALEPRLLLSADLVAGSLNHNAFDPVLPGDPVSALFEVHRPDSETLSSPIRIQLYASTDSSLDAADTPLGQADIPASQLQPGANTVSLVLDTRALAEPGRYALIGVIDPDDTIGESDESNNQAIATQDFNLAFRVGELPGRNPVPSIEFADADGTRVTLAISGPGIADLSTDGAGYRLTITGSNASTRVELTGSGGDGRVVLSGITAASPLGSLNAAIASLDGAATFGAVNSLVLGDIATGARLDGNSLASLSVSRDALGDLRLAGSGVSGFVLGSAQVGGAIGGLWSISGRGNSVSAQTTRADWRANFSAPLTQLAVRGNASGQFAASALQILQVGGSLRGMDVRIGANLGSDAVLGGSGDAADQFGPGTLARLRISGDIEDSTIVVGIDPRNGAYLDGDDQQLGTPTQRVQELLVGGQLKGTTQIVAPAFPASVRVGGATVNPAHLAQLTTSTADVIAPALGATLLHDTGADPSDRLTNDPTIHGQATDAGGVRRLLVALDAVSPTLLDVSQALQVDGRFVLSDALLDMLAGGRLADGAQAIRLVAEDATGNRSAAATVSFSLDRDVATPALQLALDSGRDDHDRITHTGTLNIAGSEAGASLEYSIDAGASWSPDFTPVEGDNSVAVRQTDLAGNVSSAGTLAFVLDTVAPGAPDIDLLAASDSGLLADDNLTHDSTPTLALSSEAGSVITLSRGGSVVASSLVGPQADFTSEVLADGEARFFASSEDLAGNRSATGELAITIDTLAPTLTVALANDTGAQDGITRDPTINGNAGDPLALTAFSGSFGTDLASFTDLLDLVQPDGSFTIDAARLATVLGDTLTDGAHTLRLVAIDAAGNRSPIVERAFTLDTAAPAFVGFGLSVSDASNAALDETSAATAQITGRAEAGAAIRLGSQNIEVLAGAGGAFVMPGVSLAPGANALTLTATDAAGNATTLLRTLTRTAAVQSDAVLEWNEIALHAVRLDVTDPPVATRTLAMVSLAQYDALAAIDGTPAYLVSRSVSGPVSAPAAVAVAAHRVLSQTYPAQKAVFDGALAAGLAAIADGEAKDRGIALGLAVADAVLALRANDGSEDFVAYDGSTAIGSWRPTGPMFDVADDPQWGTVQPFALRSPDQYRPAAPPALDTAAYATAVEEVKRLGSAGSSERTADQTEQALFWADGKGSYTPPGHWNQIAAEVARAQGNSLAANARLFAQLNVALADAAIACWDAKYAYGLWRPETAIQNADLDNNAATTLDSAWRPLLLTPAHPEYVSGHSSFSMAAATVLAANFGDATAFTTTSPTLPGVTRSFSSFTEAAQEAGRSRIHGGIHYEFTNQAGQQLGTQVGNAVLARFALASDTQAPAIVLGDAPAATNTNLTLHGQVFDNLSGVATAQFQIDGGALEALVLDASGGFTITTALATDGSADAAHTIRIVASDAAGNANAGVTRGFVLDTTPPTLVLNSLADGDTLGAASRLTGTADATGSALTQLSYRIDGGTSRGLIFDGSGTFDESLAHGDLDVGNHTLLLTARDAAGNVATLSRTLTVNALAPLAVTSLTPTDGADDVGVTVRPQVRFSRAVNVATLTADSFYATGPDGSKLAATIVPGNDGTFAWLFFTNPMPGASRVTLHVDGSRIRGAGDGSFLDADGDGTACGTLEQSFTTVSRSAVIGTTLVGKVVDPGPDLEPMSFDDIRRGPDGVIHTSDDLFLLPIAHAKVYILGQESQFVYTDADGNFELTDTPAGTVKVAVDGRTATNAPADVFFPEMEIDVELTPGVSNTVMGGMGSAAERLANLDRREIYLPRVPTNAMQQVSDTSPTVITLTDAASAPQLTEQERAALTLTVQPGSVIGEDGQVLQNVQIGMATVPPELVRDMLPPGVLQHTFDITIQAPGVATFAEPVQITFPNVFNAAPGTKLSILSFDHTTGRLVINGTGTVSADGTTVVSDADSGIRAPGWHGVTPPGSRSSGPSSGTGGGGGGKKPPQGTLSINFRLVQLDPTSPFGFNPIKPYADYTDAASFTDWTAHTVRKPIASLGTGPTAIQVRVTPADPKDLDSVSLHAFARSTTSGSVNVEYLSKNRDSKEYLLYSDLTVRSTLLNKPNTVSADPPMEYHLHATSSNDYEDADIRQSPGATLQQEYIDFGYDFPKLDFVKDSSGPPEYDDGSNYKPWVVDAGGSYLASLLPGARVKSGYRNPESNLAEGGGEHSAHMWGGGVDLAPPVGGGIAEMVAIYQYFLAISPSSIPVAPGVQAKQLFVWLESSGKDGVLPYNFRIPFYLTIGGSTVELADTDSDGLPDSVAKITGGDIPYDASSHELRVDPPGGPYRFPTSTKGSPSGPVSKDDLKFVIKPSGAGQDKVAPGDRLTLYFKRPDDKSWTDEPLSYYFTYFAPPTPEHRANHVHVDVRPYQDFKSLIDDPAPDSGTPDEGEGEPMTPAPVIPDGVSTASGFGSVATTYFRFAFANGTELGGSYDPALGIDVVLPEDTAYVLYTYQPLSNTVDIYDGFTARSGAVTGIGDPVASQLGGKDTDNDGLPDLGEMVMGTSLTKVDSDRDGLNDSAELDMGLNPLDGGGLPAGVLAVTGLQGEAKEVVLAARTDRLREQLAYVATGSYGLAIVDPRNMLKPVVVGQLELPGDAVDLSLDSPLNLAAVATGVSLEVVDVSNPTAPRVVRSIPVAAGQVEVVDGVAYVAVGSAIESYNLLTGERLDSIPSGAGDIVSLTTDRNFLFVADSGQHLAAVDISRETMRPVGAIDLPASSGKVFVGGGIAYIGGGASGGFVTVDVSNPAAMVLLSGVDGTLVAGDAVVATGSGDALALGVSRGEPVLHLVDVRDPTRTDRIVDRFRLPFSAYSVAVGSGLAFVAGGTTGLVVVNHRAFDTAGQQPIVTASAPGADIDPATDGTQVLEGTTLDLDVVVQDDRQIARVELLVDGQVVVSDVSYPWPGSVVLPTIQGTDDMVRIQLRAVDTGGNVGLSGPIELQLVRDTVAPLLVRSNVPDGIVKGTTFRVATLEFSEALDPRTVTPATVLLSDSSGTVIGAQDIRLRRDGVELQVTYPALAEGAYRLRLVASAITDRIGNSLGASDLVSNFTVGQIHTVEWIGGSIGFWDDPANWSSGVLPGSGDDVVIDSALGGLIDHRAGATTIRSLTAHRDFRLSGGTLELTADSSINGRFTLARGTLAGAGTLTLAGTGNRWDGGAMTGGGATRVAPGGVLVIGGGASRVVMLGNRTIHNDGTLQLAGSGLTMNLNGSSVLDNSGVLLLEAGGGIVQDGGTATGNLTILNSGSIAANLGPQNFRFRNSSLNSSGEFSVQTGTVLFLSGSSASGSGSFLVAANSTLEVGGGELHFVGTGHARGDGLLKLSAGLLSMENAANDIRLVLTGGELRLLGPVTARFLDMTGGAITGVGPLTLTQAGSELWGGTISVPIIEPPDTVQPSIVRSSVTDGSTFSLINGEAPDSSVSISISLTFSESMDPSTLVSANFHVLNSSGLQLHPTSVVPIGDRFKSLLLEFQNLSRDTYRLVVHGQNLRDHRGGQSLVTGETTVATFEVVRETWAPWLRESNLPLGLLRWSYSSLNAVISKGFRELELRFSEPIDPATLSGPGIQLTDGQRIYTPDVLSVTPYGSGVISVILSLPPLPHGSYRIVLDYIKDLSGNIFDGSYVDPRDTNFRVTDAKWLGPVGSSALWNDPGNWEGGYVPLPTDDIFVDDFQNLSVIGNVEANSIELGASSTLSVSSGIVRLAETLQGPRSYQYSTQFDIRLGPGGGLSGTPAHPVAIQDPGQSGVWMVIQSSAQAPASLSWARLSSNALLRIEFGAVLDLYGSVWWSGAQPSSNWGALVVRGSFFVETPYHNDGLIDVYGHLGVTAPIVNRGTIRIHAALGATVDDPLGLISGNRLIFV